MTAAELTCQVLDLRNIHFHKNDYWSCWEVNEKEEIGEFDSPAGDWLQGHHTLRIRCPVFPSERPVHYQERVLPLSCETDSYLIVKKHVDMEAMVNYLGEHANHNHHSCLINCTLGVICHRILHDLSFFFFFFLLVENKVLVSKTGTIKYREERNLIISTGFHSRYFILDSRLLKMFKDVRVSSFCARCSHPSLRVDGLLLPPPLPERPRRARMGSEMP